MLNNVLHMHLKLLRKEKFKGTTAGTTGDFISNEIADKITKVSKTSQQNNLETVENE